MGFSSSGSYRRPPIRLAYSLDLKSDRRTMTFFGQKAAARVLTPSQLLDVEAHRIGIAGGALLHTFLDVGGQAVEVQQRLGVHADHAVDDELQTGQADTSVGQLGEVEGAVRIADVHHDLERQLGHGVDGVLANVEAQLAFEDE